jgi:hypothetical protein
MTLVTQRWTMGGPIRAALEKAQPGFDNLGLGRKSSWFFPV